MFLVANGVLRKMHKIADFCMVILIYFSSSVCVRNFRPIKIEKTWKWVFFFSYCVFKKELFKPENLRKR